MSSQMIALYSRPQDDDVIANEGWLGGMKMLF